MTVITPWVHYKRIAMRIEFKLTDMWIGCYWEKRVYPFTCMYDRDYPVLHIWICVLPCFPLHITKELW